MIKNRLEVLKKFQKFIGPRVTRLLAFSALAGVFLFAVEASFVLVIQGFLFALGLMDETALNVPSWFPLSLTSTAIMLTTLGLLRMLTIWLKYYLAHRTGLTFVRDVRKKLIHIALLPNKIPSSQLLSAFGDHSMQSGHVMTFIGHLLVLSISSILLLVVAAKLAFWELLIGISLMAITAIPLKFYSRYVVSLSGQSAKELEKVNDRLANIIRNKFFLRAFGLEGPEVEKASASLDSHMENYRKFYSLNGILRGIPNFVGMAVVATIALVSKTYFDTSSANLIGFFYVFLRIGQSFGELANVYGQITIHSVAIRRLYDTITVTNKANVGRTLEQGQDFKIDADIEIDINDVSFSYDNVQNSVFSDVSLKLKRGELITLAGSSGEGKSTLLALLLGLEKPTSGSILVNGNPVSDVRTGYLKQVGYVGAEPFLINASVRENLLYGHPNPNNVTEADLADAIEKARCQFIYDMPQGLEYRLSEIAELSMGQKQRLCYARALLRKPQLLILDEPTANLDEKTEALIIESLEDMKPNFAGIVVSHKEVFGRIADQKYLIKGGKLSQI